MLTRDGEREVQRGGGGGGEEKNGMKYRGDMTFLPAKEGGGGLGNLWKTIKVILSTLQAGTKK